MVPPLLWQLHNSAVYSGNANTAWIKVQIQSRVLPKVTVAELRDSVHFSNPSAMGELDSDTIFLSDSLLLTIVGQQVHLGGGDGHRVRHQRHHAPLGKLVDQLNPSVVHLFLAVWVQDQPDSVIVAQPVWVGAQSHSATPTGLQFGQHGGDLCFICIHKHLKQIHY